MAPMKAMKPKAMKAMKTKNAKKAMRTSKAKPVKTRTMREMSTKIGKGAGKGVLVNQPGTLGMKLLPGFYGQYKKWYLGPAGNWWVKSSPPWDQLFDSQV